MKRKKIFIIAASGMAGSGIFNYFKNLNKYFVVGTVRKKYSLSENTSSKILENIDLFDWKRLREIILTEDPDIVINCSGVIKQVKEINNIESVIHLNSVIPSKIEHLANVNNFKFINLSTDCVFNGIKGNYVEEDIPNADDLYAISKYLGEVQGKNSLTLRTSIIGHELRSYKSLVDWFLSQKDEIKGFSNAIFSGLPTNILAQVIDEYIIDSNLNGLYHISSKPISKYELLKKIAKVYSKDISIKKDPNFIINRSLDCTKFSNATGYKPYNWDELIDKMHSFYQKHYI